MKIGCAALYPITRYGFPYSLDNYLKAVAEMASAGFEYCELEINVDNDLQEYFDREAEVQQALSDHKINDIIHHWCGQRRIFYQLAYRAGLPGKVPATVPVWSRCRM